MANNDELMRRQIEKEKRLVKKMLSQGKVEQALAKAKELGKQKVYTKKEFLNNAQEYGSETKDLQKLLKPAWYLNRKSSKKKDKKNRKK
jgi:translation initiation factor 6 (eIF-6)